MVSEVGLGVTEIRANHSTEQLISILGLMMGVPNVTCQIL